MDNGNFEQNDKKIESVFSTRIRAGKRRTYFFDVRATRGNDFFITITESRKRFDNNGYDRHKIFLYKVDFNKFLKALTEAVDNNFAPARQAEPHVDEVVRPAVVEESKEEAPEQDIDPATITEKKPLEARDTHASQGDNLSNEEVDKW